ncbi:response regulator [Bosea sp. UNC402CLCol]|uniref:response regulator n=1 Tax=Bosea sp. UNC402CLCol TaxID=1510531 RepID=UPI00068ACFD0|nr:response regulator [Bosea sp. UNC402CLCol]
MAAVRVLIVEDDPFIAMDIEMAVAEQLGEAAELIVVESVAQAWRAAAGQLSCALLDIDVVDGKTFEVADTLRKTGIPFAFVSGSAPQEVPKPLRQARFLRKPFSTREVVAFVMAAIGGIVPESIA